MGIADSNSLPAIGFLTVVSLADRGLVGGYLVLNTEGRPLEFHCTAPVKANRAQEILYGPTLRPYLYGEQIGTTLLSRAKHRAMLAATDVQHVLAARRFTSLPLILVLPAASLSQGESDEALATSPRCVPNGSPPHQPFDAARIGELVQFTLGTQRVAVCPSHESDLATVTERWQTHISAMDLCEPFERIHEAIEEVQASC